MDYNIQPWGPGAMQFYVCMWSIGAYVGAGRILNVVSCITIYITNAYNPVSRKSQ